MIMSNPVNDSPPVESVLWDDWHPVAELAPLQRTGILHTMLFGVPLTVTLAADGAVAVSRHGAGLPDRRLEHVDCRYGLIWASLGTPTRDIIDFPETRESDRIVCTGGSVGVAVSGLRAVENFLDLGHLAFVHAGYLGEEPYTEICTYKVEPLPEGGILATGCRVYQPRPSPMDSQGFDVDYVYAVRRPYIVALLKANPVEKERMDMIALLAQPVTEERCVAHVLMAYPPHNVDSASLRWFQQLIFGQDRPILENQIPKRLPLDPRAEISIRADNSSAHYRRWLASIGVRYGAVPIGAS
jgi:phenylpropionate dioxygenase-like ring-hydroxylating dioxygenase large terminal subunit